MEKQQASMFDSTSIEVVDTRAKLEQQYIVPPFSILDTRQGYWQERKRLWLSLGIESEVGRGENLLQFSDTVRLGRKKSLMFISASGGDPLYYTKKMAVEKQLGKELTCAEFEAEYYEEATGRYATGTSIFDPVLCELMYRWFCPEKGVILDPFAGGSVRGIVASILGYGYHGIDLSQMQIEANRQQATQMRVEPVWYVGDSLHLDQLLPQELMFDFIFTCPPYHDLEKYTDDMDDLSNMSWQTFKSTYKAIIVKAILRLKPNRFACFVVSEIRADEGHFKGLVPFTISSFLDGGMWYYNEIILVNAVGSLSIRIGGSFNYRKIGRCHQNVLVFYKGDPELIPRHFNEIKQDISLKEGVNGASRQGVTPAKSP